MSQYCLEGFEKCGCWTKVTDEQIVAGFSCPGCIKLALAYLEDLLYLDKVGSVSGPVEVEEDSVYG